MAVYVDDARLKFRNMRMCHMIADTPEELLEMVDKISVQRRWIQRKGTRHEHFDICLSKRALAVNEGAIEISGRTLGMMLRDRRLKERGE